MPTVHEHFSQQFQKWEVRGRGWQVFDQPVYPEPPFTPFAYRSMMETPAVDDGRRHTFLSSLMEKASQKLAPPAPSRIQPEPEDDPQPVFLNRGSMVELQAALPADFDISRDSFEYLFRNLALCREPVAFELVGSYRSVLVQFAACEEDVSLVRRQLQAILPDVQFRQQTGTLKTAHDARKEGVPSLTSHDNPPPARFENPPFRRGAGAFPKRVPTAGARNFVAGARARPAVATAQRSCRQ